MLESLSTMQQLIEEVAAHLKASTARDRTAARKKLDRLTALSSTMSLTLVVKR